MERWTSRGRRGVALPVITLAVASLATGCGSDDGSTVTPGTTAITSSATASSMPSSTASSPTTVQVVATTLVPAEDRPGPVDGTPQPPVSIGGELDPDSPLVTGSVEDLAARLGIDASSITVVAANSVTWPDGALGCPEPGMGYAQVLSEGARVVLEVDGVTYEYHGGAVPFLCGEP